MYNDVSDEFVEIIFGNKKYVFTSQYEVSTQKQINNFYKSITKEELKRRKEYLKRKRRQERYKTLKAICETFSYLNERQCFNQELVEFKHPTNKKYKK